MQGNILEDQIDDDDENQETMGEDTNNTSYEMMKNRAQINQNRRQAILSAIKMTQQQTIRWT